MKRIIKFRAWDKTQKLFLKEDDFKWFAIRALWNDEKCCNSIIWSQFTGLTDKNKKEIYEGDIIQFEFKGELKTSLIKEHSEDYCYWMSLPMGRREFEVIGNIYENSELLK